MKFPLLYLFFFIGCDAFTTKTTRRLSSFQVLSNPKPPHPKPLHEFQTWNHQQRLQVQPAAASTTSLQLFPSAAVNSVLGSSRVLRGATALLGGLLAVLLLMRNSNEVHRLLYPSMAADKMYNEPLPPAGSWGCPFLGTPFFLGSRDFGAGNWYRKVSQRLGPQASIFTFQFMNRAFAVVGGARNVKHVLSQEFEPNGLSSAMRRPTDKPTLMGSSTLITEQDKQQHSFLRRLVGQAITPAAVVKSIPNLQAAAEACVDKMLLHANNNPSNPIKMDTICTDFTFDVAWKQILGLDLSSPAEIDQFRQAVNVWIGGLSSWQAFSGMGVDKSPAYKAKQWIESKVEEKIEALESQPQEQLEYASTLSGMVFASDDVDNKEDNNGVNNNSNNRKLTRRQIIDNAMLLILAGSETSASTLTNCMLLLGLHKEAWNKLVEEQNKLQAKYGDALSKETLDKECPYLEAVIKESMRLKPVAGGIPRIAKETMIVNGKQIPKGWIVDWSVVLTHELDPKTYQEDGSHMDVKKGFVPERWLDDTTTPSDFLPMGAGPRYCLGANLAYAEMKVFLAVLARKLDFELTGNTEVLKWKRMSIIPKVVDGVPVKVQARQSLPTHVQA